MRTLILCWRCSKLIDISGLDLFLFKDYDLPGSDQWFVYLLRLDLMDNRAVVEHLVNPKQNEYQPVR